MRYCCRQGVPGGDVRGTRALQRDWLALLQLLQTCNPWMRGSMLGGMPTVPSVAAMCGSRTACAAWCRAVQRRARPCRLGTWHLGVGGELPCHAALPPQHLAQRHSEAPALLTQRPECRSSPITALDRAAVARQQHPAAPRPCPARPWNPPSGPKAHSGSQAQTASDRACCLAGPSAWAHAQPCLQFLTRAQSHAARCPAAPGVHARATVAALMPLLLRAPSSSSRAHLATSSALLRCVGLNRASAPMRVPAQASHLRTAACSAVRDAGHAVSTCRCATQP